MPRYFEGNHVGHYTRTAFVKKENSITTTYFQNGANPIQTSSEAIKDDNFNLILEKNVTADGLIEEKLYNYANNHPVLTPRNIITTPLQIISKRNNSPISKSEIKYENPSNIYPSYTLSYYLTSNENDWENSINANIDKRFDIYDDMGNMVQQSINPTSTEEALFVTTIWGYNKSLPIANIVGAKLNQLNIDSVNLLVTRSDEYANASPSAEVSAEANYLSALESFRIANASSEYQITGYSYYPLIGISQVIPPNGIKEIYEYDNYNRLMKIKNVNGIVLKEVNYNNKQ